MRLDSMVQLDEPSHRTSAGLPTALAFLCGAADRRGRVQAAGRLAKYLN
jgi:hypothetical protein